MADRMDEPARRNRRWIALAMVVLGAGGVIFFSIAAIWIASAEDKTQVIREIYPALLGIFGTWVGTVLSFYFSQDNFTEASRETRSLMRESGLTASHRDTTPLDELMMAIGQVPKLVDADGTLADTLTLKDLDGRLPGGDSRLFVLAKDGTAVLLIYGLVLDSYLKTRTQQGADPLGETLADLLAFEGGRFKARMDRGVMTFLPPGATVREAKARLKENQMSWDVVVTEDGTEKTPVLGWVSNHQLTAL